jgi:hypothetical protein
MRTVTQSHEGQQRPVMLDCWVVAILETNPSLNFWTPRVVEVDNADKRRKHSRRGQGRHIAVIRMIRELDTVEW